MATTATADIHLSFEGLPPGIVDVDGPSSPPWYTRRIEDENKQIGLSAWRLQDGSYTFLRFRDGTRFLIDRAGTRIWAAWPEPATLEDTTTYLLGPILGYVLRLRGISCFHASGVAVDGRALALVGPGRRGKSTTAAALARRGYPILSEDVLPVVERDGVFLAQPGYSYIRLWPKSVAILFGSPDQLPRLAPPWDKRFLDLAGGGGCSFQSQPIPLGGLYLLARRVDSPEAPLIQSLSRREALLSLVANTHSYHLLDQRQRLNDFALFSRLVADIAVKRVVPHSDPARLTELCDLLVDDFQASAEPTQPEP